MIRIAFFLLFVIFLTGCSSPLQASPSSSPEVVLSPLATPTAIVTPTVTEVTLTATLQPTPPDPNFFRDDFNGTLDPLWTWVRESPGNWSLVAAPGSLQINAHQGYVAAHNNSNLLLRPAPSQDFQIETQITFEPEDDFQFAGLIIYESDANFVQAGREYCKAVNCVGEGLYMDSYENGVVMKPNFGQSYRGIDPILLRLSRRENTYTFEASTDGKVWFIVGSHTSDIKPSQIGLVAGQMVRGNILPATFDFFEVRSLP